MGGMLRLWPMGTRMPVIAAAALTTGALQKVPVWGRRFLRHHALATDKMVEEALYSEENKARIELIYKTQIPSTASQDNIIERFVERYRPFDKLPKIDLANFPYFLHPIFREELLAYSQLHFDSPNAVGHLSQHCPTFSGIMVLQTLRRDMELYQEAIAMAVARNYGASFIAIDALDFAPRRGFGTSGKSERGRGRSVGIPLQPFLGGVGMPPIQIRQVGTGQIDIQAIVGTDPRGSEENNRFQTVLKCLFEARNSSKVPMDNLVIYVRNFPALFGDEERLKALNKELKAVRKDTGVLVVGSTAPQEEQRKESRAMLVQRLMGEEGEEEEDDRTEGLEVQNVANLWIQEPTGHERDMWLRKLSVDAKVLLQRDNHRQIARVLDQVNIHHDSFASVQGLEKEELDAADVELLVGWGLGMQISDATTEAESDLQIEDNRESKGTKITLNLFLSAAALTSAVGLWLRRSEIVTRQMAVKKPHPGVKDVPKLNSFEKKLLPNLVTPGTIGVGFNDIGALDHCKTVLREIITLPLIRPELFSKGLLSRSPTGVLLFGPPGTGKTMLAKAVAVESGSNFLHVSMSDIMNKYVGQSEKNAKAVFTLARKMAPCVIFLDEVDSLFSNRDADRYTSKREALNEFMQEWDGLTMHSGRVLVMAATNRPYDLDEAVIRRLPRRLMVDLPDTDAREAILSIILRNEELAPTVTVARLAAETKGYTGSDLNNLCLAAATRTIRELIAKEQAEGVKYSSVPPLEWHHFEAAKEDIKESVNEESESSTRLHDWNAKYGEGRARRKRPQIGFSAKAT
eukprot:comp23767_c2_seq1/m.41171 comp23767_c2_seq1/g.41171  ORF comp23767_c2_seq1/g.41171 comp23767_c2_seq1/m.41171 type:complete len:801 (-) comp23767_c2_seq1:214-2616(-)